jgi:hypothetical protein
VRYALADNVVIMVDNAQRAAGHLQPGMNVTALANATGDIVSLVARSATVVQPIATAQPIATTQPVATAQPAPVVLYREEGLVVSTTPATQSVRIRTQRLRLSGEVFSEERDYMLASQAVIKRGETIVAFTDIKANDIVLFNHNGTLLFEIVLEEKERHISGTLTEKKFNPVNHTASLVIEDASGARFELRVTPDTRITRGMERNPQWNHLRIGDAVEVQSEFDRLVSVTATGQRTTVNGRLEEIRLSQQAHQLTVRRDDGSHVTYHLPVGVYDVYSLRIGMLLRLYLDSWEIFNIDIL